MTRQDHKTRMSRVGVIWNIPHMVWKARREIIEGFRPDCFVLGGDEENSGAGNMSATTMIANDRRSRVRSVQRAQTSEPRI